MPARTTRLPEPLYARYEGANMGVAIGFKHVLYVVEDAVLAWLRLRGFGAARLWQDFGLGVDVTGMSARLPALTLLDDAITADVSATDQPGRLAVRLSVNRHGRRTTTARATVTVQLTPHREPPSLGAFPHDLAAMAAPGPLATSPERRRDQSLAGRTVESALAASGAPGTPWTWQARYFHCHHYDRVNCSAYVRALEEVVDRFLAGVGLPIAAMLADHRWVPVVSRVQLRSLAEARADEAIHTVFGVDTMLGRVAYDGHMDCYVQRGDTLVHIATAAIIHGYIAADIRADAPPHAVRLDDRTFEALAGAVAST